MEYCLKNNYFHDYFALRDKIDSKAAVITAYYADNIICRSGCSSCCIPISLMPVEFYAIKKELEDKKLPPGLFDGFSGRCTASRSVKTEYASSEPDGNIDTEPESCIFLNNSACSIYRHRPVICRTQGLPLLYYSEYPENYTLAVCGLNFTAVDDDFEFDTEFAIDLDMVNSSLYRINKDFSDKNHYQPGKDTDGRIPLKLLFEILTADRN